ncbi:MAG: hypothetical protein AAF641_13375 [Pseudomonadota bacterium]
MRRLWRFTKWALLLLVALIIGLLAPVGYNEAMCRGDGPPAPATPLSGETRAEVRTLLTYPEWHIVHAYDDYAEVIRTGDPHQFKYLAAIGGYWSSLCSLTEESAQLGEIDASTKQLVYVIGVSFTFEMLVKALYEETLGRLAASLRGSDRAQLDDLSAEQAAAYAKFLRQVPWHQYDFRADAAALAEAATGSLRDRERSSALGFEHRNRAAYAEVIAAAVEATGPDDLTLQMVITAIPQNALTSVEGVRVIGPVEDGLEIETPRYRQLTGILANWAAQGANFIDIAGNDQIMFTAISQTPQIDGALASLPRQGYGDTRHLFLLPVTELADTLRGLAARDLTLEHIHDY